VACILIINLNGNIYYWKELQNLPLDQFLMFLNLYFKQKRGMDAISTFDLGGGGATAKFGGLIPPPSPPHLRLWKEGYGL